MKKLYPMGVIFLIFLVGIAFILYPSIGNFITLNTASVTISDYDRKIQELPDTDMKELRQRAWRFNRRLYYGTNGKDEDKCLNLEDGVICYLNIPKISVYLPVYYGTSDEVLRKGCGYIENTSLPIGGVNTNSGISGHTGLPGAEMLSELDQMKESDIFFIHVLGTVLAYQVELVKVVEPEEPEDLEIQPGRDLVTLVTCTPYGINSHRLLVRGERIPWTLERQEKEGQGATQVTSGLSGALKRQLAVIAVIVLTAAFAAGVAGWYHHRLKLAGQRRKEESAEPGNEELKNDA